MFQQDYFPSETAGLMVSVSYSGVGLGASHPGSVVAGAGVALTRGETWARIVAVIVAVVSAITNVAFMSAYPSGRSS